jgi:iron complex outermembrane receptor protein
MPPRKSPGTTVRRLFHQQNCPVVKKNLSFLVSLVGTACAVGFFGAPSVWAQNAKSSATPNASKMDTTVVLTAAEVAVFRADERTPVTFTLLSAPVLKRENNARDLPFVLQNVPNAVVASDAGTGMGYTYFRLRGSDQTRINVTLNGVPLNDPESHGVFWVNTPDLTSSLASVQIQRGVGTSTVGTGAFGGSVSLETAAPSGKRQKTFIGTGSWPLGYRGTYLWEGPWVGRHKNLAFSGRVTHQRANGYVDRSGMELHSAVLNGIWRYGATETTSQQGSLRFFYTDGQERTQQAWYGIPEAKYRGDSAGVEAYIARNYLSEDDAQNLRTSGNRTYNAYTYPNEIDRYRQTHYQLQWNQRLNASIRVNANLFAVRGRGYFEQFKRGESFADYGLPNPVVGSDTLQSTDLVRRRWLDNRLVGSNGNLITTVGAQQLTLGYNVYSYVGHHFGTLPWMGQAAGSWADDGPFSGNGWFDQAEERRYYDDRNTKNEGSAFARLEGSLGALGHGYTDLQIRRVAYRYAGEGQSGLFQRMFFNPKMGWSRGNGRRGLVYASVAAAHREPIRADFIDALGGSAPLPEQLLNGEMGYRRHTKGWSLEANVYAMEYRNQLVPTGALNDVGAVIRVNVPVSWRRGVELDGSVRLGTKNSLQASASFSDNRIAEFTEVLYDYAADPVETVSILHRNTPIALSPNWVGAVHWNHERKNNGFRVSLRSVGRQYLDNTGAAERSLDGYATVDLRWTRKLSVGEFQLDVINATNTHYAPNGATWSYLYAGERTVENFYFPMAGTQLMATFRIQLEE